MPRDVRRPNIYRAPINLYVEDGATRAYLSELWNDPAVAFFIGGGAEGVEAIVRTEQAAGHVNVFGLIDRDYRRSNREKWSQPGKTFAVFILPVHEIENYLLDVAALSGSRYHNRHLSPNEIQQFLIQAATRLCWWAACRDVVAELKRRFREGFIPDPNQAIVDEASARQHICASAWFAKLMTETNQTTQADVYRLLEEAHVRASRQLEDGTWQSDFAGKEILKDVSSRICHRPDVTNFPPHESEFWEDLAKEIAAWQVVNSSGPPELAELLESLKARIARVLPDH